MDVLLRLAYHLIRSWSRRRHLVPSTRARRHLKKIVGIAQRYRRMAFASHVMETYSGVVQRGPFQGLKVSSETSWGGGDIAAKVLGTYEQELFPVVEAVRNKRFDAIVNIGCAEGFYAVGLARIIDAGRVIAVDIDAGALKVCEETHALNGLTTPFEYRSTIDHADLEKILESDSECLIFSDCEGCEKSLICETEARLLDDAFLIIECHDFVDPTITPSLQEHLSQTHRMKIVREGARDPNEIPDLRKFDSDDRWLMISENRPETMHWLIAIPISSADVLEMIAGA